MKKFCCASPMVGRHLSNCPFRGVKVDFSDLRKILAKLEKQSKRDAKQRDPKRIPKILKQIEELWSRNPELRLLQLLMNPFPSEWPPYYLEDRDLVKALEKFYKSKNRRSKKRPR